VPVQIVERLLIEKPDNPISFIVEYLQKTYPDQAQVSTATLHPEENKCVSGLSYSLIVFSSSSSSSYMRESR